LADNIKKDTKSFYAYVRSKAKAKINVGPLVNKDGEVISLAEDMSEEFNKFFISVFSKEGNESILEAEWTYKGPTDEQLCDLEITDEQVLSELERLRDDKAAGADDLVPRFLSNIKGDISYPLTLLFQRIMDDREVPEERREENVVSIFKNKRRGEASSYRPVSLTSQTSKVFESIIRDEVVSFFERHGVIKETEHGFRNGKSCLTNLLVILDRITRCIDEGGNMDVGFLDLAKAFDKVPHKRLIEKVQKHGIGEV